MTEVEKIVDGCPAEGHRGFPEMFRDPIRNSLNNIDDDDERLEVARILEEALAQGSDQVAQALTDLARMINQNNKRMDEIEQKFDELKHCLFNNKK